MNANCPICESPMNTSVDNGNHFYRCITCCMYSEHKIKKAIKITINAKQYRFAPGENNQKLRELMENDIKVIKGEEDKIESNDYFDEVKHGLYHLY